MKRFLEVLFVFLPILTIGQVSISITSDSEKVYVGDVVKLHYKLNLPSGVQAKSLDFSAFSNVANLAFEVDTINLDKLMEIAVIDGGVFGISDDNLLVQSNTMSDGLIPLEGDVSLGIYNEGVLDIPQPKIGLDVDADAISLQTPRIQVIAPPSTDSLQVGQVNNIKDIIVEDWSWRDFVWIPIALFGFITLAIAYKYLKKYFKNTAELEPSIEVDFRQPAHVVALESLDNLKSKELWQQGYVKDYHTELTRIMRQYIEDRFGVPALEMTTTQLKKDLYQVQLDAKTVDRLVDILMIADKVKFAKGEAGAEINSRFLDEAYDIILSTQEPIQNVE